jgi:Glycosyl hydrolase family 26
MTLSPRSCSLAAISIVLAASLACAAGCSAASSAGEVGSQVREGGADPASPGADAGSSSVPPAKPDASSDAMLGLGPRGAADAGGVNEGGATAASLARQRVLAFLAKIQGNHAAVGVEDKDSTNPEADSDQMASIAGDGKNPSFWSADFGFGEAAQPGEREDIVQEGEKQWGEGAIVQYIYHACPLSWGADEQGCAYEGGTNPIDGSFDDLTDAQWQDLTTSGGTLHGVWLARLDTLATYFQELKDAGVAPLFRPLHEINGAWAWWQGRPGPTGSALLYQITHDYLVGTKGLDNIVWVWNVQDYTTLANDVTVYTPGLDYFDVAALDVYDTGYTQGNYAAMVGAAGGKPIGVAECELLPSPDVLTQQPLWTYVAMWPDFFSDDTSQIPALFGDPTILTLSDMPGWN